MIEPTVIRGLSDAYGSWKMICISFRSARSDRLSSVVTFFPWKVTSPDVGSISRRIDRPVVDFPQPDSPTSPSVSPFMMSKDTSSTACTRATSRENKPPRIGKYFFTFLTRRSGVAVRPAPVRQTSPGRTRTFPLATLPGGGLGRGRRVHFHYYTEQDT